ncbi:hypothetical protein [Paenibacillus sp. JDR-2]|uniref:hypothetical protein n=1 Tax=Paenibacillus sp. (strain JDR-2) TaxID=324057 RepID=UPI0001663FEB|nr:hypothetical protein [Paenibacillus sp. JDR-2]ACT02926.1 hypothetical protein Pjdr2_4304 [Paenibacillus sp. JDR-2]
MSKALFDLTQSQIETGYKEHNDVIIEKETEFIFNKILKTLLLVFSDKIVGITMDKESLSLPSNYLFSDKHHKNLIKWLNRLVLLEPPASDLEFGKLKIDYENWYYQLGGEKMEFIFHDEYLLTSQEAADALGVSKVTLSKYIKLGLDCCDTTSHKKIPRYAIELLKDPVYSIRMQMIAQEKKKSKQTPQERAKEINDELLELRVKYKGKSFKEIFGKYNGDEMDDPTDYYSWKSLEEELEEILKLGGGSSEL